MGYKSANCYSLQGSHATTSPSDSTAYYFGGTLTHSLTTAAAVSRLYIPRKGTIRECIIFNYSGTATGTNEDWTWAIRKNDTTDTTISTLGAATPNRTWSNYALNIAVDRGDYIEFKTTTPAWVTNPEGVRGEGIVLIYYD